MTYFSVEETQCNCCGKNLMNEEFMSKLNAIRGHCNFPFILTSAFRCAEHNKAINGAAKSSHLLGRAVDIKATGKKALTIIENARAFGFSGVGISKSFVHIDDNHQHATIWTY